MRVVKWSRLGLAALSVIVVASPALATHNGEQPPAGCRYIRGMETPEDHDDDVYVCRQDVWMHKANTRLGNLAGFGQDTVPSWNTTKPTASLQDAGAGYATVRIADLFFPENHAYRPTFRGTFTGTLDDLAVSLFLKAPVYEAAGIAWPMNVRLVIDGAPVFVREFPEPDIDLPMKTAGNLRKIDFVFNDLYEAMKTEGLDLSATAEHTVELAVIQVYWGDGHTVFFYDAAEAATGMVFNLPPASQSGYTKIDTTP